MCDVQHSARVGNLAPRRLIQTDPRFYPLGMCAHFDFAGHQDFAVRRNSSRAFDELDEPTYLRKESVIVGKEPVIDDDRQHTVDESPGILWIRARTAG